MVMTVGWLKRHCFNHVFVQEMPDKNGISVLDLHNVAPPPSDVSWFRFAPVTIVICAPSTSINHREIGVINAPTYIAIICGPPQ